MKRPSKTTTVPFSHQRNTHSESIWGRIWISTEKEKDLQNAKLTFAYRVASDGTGIQYVGLMYVITNLYKAFERLLEHKLIEFAATRHNQSAKFSLVKLIIAPLELHQRLKSNGSCPEKKERQRSWAQFLLFSEKGGATNRKRSRFNHISILIRYYYEGIPVILEVQRSSKLEVEKEALRRQELEDMAKMEDKEVIKVLVRCLVGCLVMSWRCLSIDYDEVFVPVARNEAIRLFLAYASFKDFVVYQMDVKRDFLYASRAWYETLSTYLLDDGFQRGMIDKTLFIKRDKSDILLVQVYVDDIIFWSIKKEMCTEFEKMMHKKFQMSTMGELTFFVGLQTASTPMETHKTFLKDEKGEDVDEHLYRSMIGSLMYLTSSRPDIMFATTTKAKNINEEAQLHAKVDGKKVIISKASTRRDLRSRKTKRKDTELPQTSMPTEHVVDEAVNEEMDDSLKRATTTATSLDAKQDRGNIRINTPRSGEDSLKLTELMELCTHLQQRVFDLETTNTSQAQEITSLKKRVKRLEKKRRSRTHGLKRLYKVILSARVESFVDEESLGDEDASKQGRISDINDNQDIYLVNVYRDEDIFVADKEVSAIEEVNVASITTPVSTAATTPTISMDEITLAKAMIEIKTSRPKAKGIVMQEPSETSTPTPIAKVDVLYQLAERLQAEKQEQLTAAKKAKLFMEFMKKRRKFFAAKRTVEKRHKPPTKSQQRSIMSTYLKNIDRWKPRALKNKSFAKIK
nr:hypothetical protein [Tanacetum cinerariifolium]